MSTGVRHSTTCYHCGDTCVTQVLENDKTFCCTGCRSVYNLLNQSGLCMYYDMNAHPGITRADPERQDKFAYLDNPDIVRQLVQFSDAQQTHITLYLPQIHCSSCLYLLEHLHKLQSGVVTSKINFTRKEIFIVFNHGQVSLRRVVELLTSLGYEPHISLHSKTGNRQGIARDKIYKVGVAGFCFANIMLLSFPDYFSTNSYMEENLRVLFQYLCLGLALPVLFYSATEFYVSAWGGIKNRYLNIDIPVVLAVWITFARSLYEMFWQHGPGYFDSMSGIIFFMLIGRIAQDKTHQYLSFERDYTSFFPIAVNKLFGQSFKPVPVEQVKEGDVIQLFSNELVPVDAMLSKGEASIDYSFVSGESVPVQKEVGELIYAGGKQLGGRIELLVVKPMEQSYLTNLWNKSNYTEKDTSNRFIDTLSKYFTVLILGLGLSALVYWALRGQAGTGIHALTTVLIVACPCTLLLASSFTYGNMIRILARNKLYIRHPGILEKFNTVTALVFDKTGTLTHNRDMQVSFVGPDPTPEQKRAIVSLAAQSKHPYSQAILAYWHDVAPVRLQHFKDIVGKGLEAWHEDHYIKLGSAAFFNQPGLERQSIVFAGIDNVVIGQFVLSNVYRDGFARVFRSLGQKFKQYILSGDTESEKQFLQTTLGNGVALNFNQRPDDKLAFIKGLQQGGETVMMIGDGLNDAGALKQSDIGIAVTENNNNFTPACDAILEAGTFHKLPLYFRFARYGKAVIVLSFTFSVIYNVIGLYFALQGSLSPLVAAILMPCSSISIITLTFGLSQLSAWRLKL